MSPQFALTLKKRIFFFCGKKKIGIPLEHVYIRSVTMPHKIYETLGRFPCFPLDKVKNRSSFPKLRFLTTLHGFEESALRMPPIGSVTSFFDGNCRFFRKEKELLAMKSRCNVVKYPFTLLININVPTSNEATEQ